MHTRPMYKFVLYAVSVLFLYHLFHFLLIQFNSHFFYKITQILNKNKINKTFFFNVTIHTLDANNTIAGGLLTDGRTINKVIKKEDLDYFYNKFLNNPCVLKVNCHAGFMYPGFTDSHGHFLERGFSLRRPNLKGANSVHEIRVRLLHHLYLETKKKNKKIEELYNDDKWLIGYGWDHHLFDKTNSTLISAFPLPTKHDLDIDPILKKIPILLHRIDYHSILINGRLLNSILKKNSPSAAYWSKRVYSLFSSHTTQTPDWLELSQEGLSTGIFKDKEKDFFIRLQPPPLKEEWDDALIQVQKEMHAFGLTSVHDAGISLNQAVYLEKQAKNHQLKIRIYAMLLASSFDTTFSNSNFKLLHHLLSLSKAKDLSMFTLRSIKVFLDGALGSHGAALFQPYSDLLPATKDQGHLLVPCSSYSCDELFKLVKQWDAKGLQVCIHAIGDKANHIALNILSRLPKTSRPRIEHAQSTEDMFRFGASGVIPSMQPVQFISDSLFLTSYLGTHRLDQVYPWHALFNSGVKYIPLGSDFPVESMDPKLGLYAATYFPNGPNLYKNNAPMTRLQAIYGYTKAPAYASFTESKLGQIQSNFLADLSIFSKDFLNNQVHPTQFLNATTLATIVNGEIVYSNGITISHFQCPH